MTLLLPVELATRQAGVLHRRQLRGAGIDRRAVAGRVRRGELIEIATDVFLVAGTDHGWRQRLWTGLLTARTDAVISRRSAARLHRHGRFGEVHVDVLAQNLQLLFRGDPEHAPHERVIEPAMVDPDVLADTQLFELGGFPALLASVHGISRFTGGNPRSRRCPETVQPLYFVTVSPGDSRK